MTTLLLSGVINALLDAVGVSPLLQRVRWRKHLSKALKYCHTVRLSVKANYIFVVYNNCYDEKLTNLQTPVYVTPMIELHITLTTNKVERHFA